MNMYVSMCVQGGVEVEIPIVMLCAGEGSVKIAPSGISCKCVVRKGYSHVVYSHVQ